MSDLCMVSNIDGVIIIAGEVGSFLVHFRGRDATSENSFTCPGRVNILERVRDGVRVRIFFFVERRVGFNIELKQECSKDLNTGQANI